MTQTQTNEYNFNMAKTIPSRAADNLIQEAEQSATTRDQRDSIEKTGVRTIDSDIQQGKHAIYGPIRSVLLRDTRTRLIHDLRGLPQPESKVKTLWEAHLPKPLKRDSAAAADFVLQEPTMNWGMFLNDPLIEKALVDDVVHSLLEDLSYAASHVKTAAGDPDYPKARKELVKAGKRKNGQTPSEEEITLQCGKEAPLQTWKRQCPAVYSQAESAIDDWIEIAYRKEQEHPLAGEAVGAIKTTKLMACCLLHAHLIGKVEFDVDESPLGQGPQSTKIKSPVLGLIQDKSRGQGSEGYEWRMLFAKYSQISVGTVKSVEFGAGNPDDAARLQEVFKTTGDPYEKIFDLLISEMNPRSKFFSETRAKWTPEHSVDQVSKALSPVLAMDPRKMRQKKMDPLVVFGLYSLASELEVMNRKNVYPLIGHDDLPRKMPPNFKLMLPAEVLDERKWTVGSLANAGFNPIVHERLSDVTTQVLDRLPGMKQKLMDKGILKFLKQAHTDQVILGPIKQEILQDELRKGYKFLDPEGYPSIVVQAYKDADLQKYGNLTVRDLTDRTEAAHIPTPKLRGEVLLNIFKEVVERVRHMPGAAEKLEEFLMQDRQVTVHHVCLDPKLVKSFPLQPHPLIPLPDPSRRPDNGQLLQFQSETIPYNDRHTLKGAFLSDEHFKSVAQVSGKGVLPSWSVAMQGFFSTFDKELVATAFGHHNGRAIDRTKGVTDAFVDEAREVGIMGLPYFHRAGSAARPDNTGQINYTAECKVKGIPMLRARTCGIPKYTSPNYKALKALGDKTPVREVPPYVSPHYVSAGAADILKEFLVEAAVMQAGGSMADSKTVEMASAAIDAAGFRNYYEQPLDNAEIPLYCIEGEKKSQAVEALQQLQMVEKTKEVLLAGDPEKALDRVKPVDFRAVIGMVGVWITMRKPESRDHVLRPEFSEALNLKGRDVTLMYDGDGMQPGSETGNHQVIGASVTSARVLARDFDVNPYHWRPPVGHGKGADDWLEEHAKRLDKSVPWEQRVYQSYLDMEQEFVAQRKPLRTDLDFTDITTAQAAGKRLDDFVTDDTRREAVSR